jgi:glycosyltransferase involved in cell wall biosynthesis
VTADHEKIRVEAYSSVGGAAFMARLFQEWRDAGMDVTAFHSLSEQEYRSAGHPVVRRWRMYPKFAWTCWRAARRRRLPTPIRIVTTNPFFAPALVARSVRDEGITVNLIYDLFPDALVHAGRLNADSWLTTGCSSITRYALGKCDVSVFLGRRLLAHAVKTYGPARRAIVIPVGADGSGFRSFPPEPRLRDKPPCILYCGLMGSMHDVDTLSAVLAGPSPAPLKWLFHASGLGYQRLKSVVGVAPNVTWGGPLDDGAWKRAMISSDVALVTVGAGAEHVVMPSKTYSAMVAGQAILAICPRESDLADLIYAHDCGWVVEPGDVDGLRGVLRQIEGNAGDVLAKRRKSFTAGQEIYDMKPVARAWLELFRELLGSARTAVSVRGADQKG